MLSGHDLRPVDSNKGYLRCCPVLFPAVRLNRMGYELVDVLSYHRDHVSYA